MQQQAAGQEGGRAGDVEDKRKAGRAGDVEDKRGAGQTSGLARGAAARRRRGQDDDATIAATANISRFSSVRMDGDDDYFMSHPTDDFSD